MVYSILGRSSMIYVIFLRGINTGGMTLRMDDFKEILLACGCRDIMTIQAAGTAIFALAKELTPDIQADIEGQLTRHIGKPVHSIIKDSDFIRRAAGILDQIESKDGFHDYVLLTEDEGIFDEIARLHERIPFTEGERLIQGSGYFVWTIRKGDTLGEFGSKILGAKPFRDKLTSRNFRTFKKVVDTIKALEGK
jgi:uncharacterized protein (DUF1697 family)